VLRDAALVAGKDLRVELRSRVATNQVAPYAVLVLIVFAFALDPDRGFLAKAAPGLFWVAVIFSALLTVQRSFAIESVEGGRDALRLSGLDPVGIFAGKAAAIAVQLVLLELVLGVGVVVLYDAPLGGVALLASTCVLATVGLAAAGTVFGVLAAGLRIRETLLPLLALPVLATLILSSTRATEYALAGTPADGWPWVELLGIFAVVYAAFGAICFGPLLEES
jgi:heme exporter protein B